MVGAPPLNVGVTRCSGWGSRCRRVGEPGRLGEAERAQDRGLVATDGQVGADLEVGPAEFVLDLFVALFDPVPQPVQAQQFGQVGGWVWCVAAAGGIVRTTGSALANAVAVMLRSCGANNPARYSRKPRRWARCVKRSSNRAA